MSTEISDLVQDGQGFLWTIYGLQRFDGYNFKTYKGADLSDSLGMRIDIMSNRIGLHVDGAGAVWIEGAGSLCLYDSEKDGFVTYHPWAGLNEIIEQPLVINSLAGDKNDLWIGTYLGLCHFKPGTAELKRYLRTGDTRNNISIILDRGKYIICRTVSGLWKFDKSKEDFTRSWPVGSDSTFFIGKYASVQEIFPYGDYYWWLIHINHPDAKIIPKPHHVLVKTDSLFSVIQRFNLPSDLVEVSQDNQEVFWIATSGKGVLKYDPRSDQSTVFANEPGNPYSLPSNSIRKLIVDRDQNVWVMTDKGLSRLAKKRVDFYNYQFGTGWTAGIEFMSGKAKNFLVVASQSSGLWTAPIQRDELGALKFQRIDIKDEPANLRIEGTAKGHNAFWLDAETSVLRLPFNPNTGIIEGRVVQDLHHDPQNPNSINGAGFIRPYLLEDQQQNLWVPKYGGENGSSLNKIVFTQNGEVDTVLRFQHDPHNPNSISPGDIASMYPEGKDSMWAPTAHGLDLFHDGRFDHVFNRPCVWVSKASDGTILVGTPNDGLFEGRKVDGQYKFVKVEALGDKYIYAIEEDRLGRLWISTGITGLFCYNRKDQTVQHFQKGDGYEGDVNALATVQTADGTMAFPTKDGLVLFDPMTLLISETKRRPLITELKVNNKSVVVEGHPARAILLLLN